MAGWLVGTGVLNLVKQYEPWADFINQHNSKGVENVSINQATVSKNIRGLQSRTHGRGCFIAELEAKRTLVKQTIKGLRLLGHPGYASLLDQRDELNYVVREEAKDQTLDRQLLKQQYVLQGIGRPAKAPKVAKPNNDPRIFKVGDAVVAIKDQCAFFKEGCKGVVSAYSYSGGGPTDCFWVDFRHEGNPPGSYDPNCNGTWCVDSTFVKHDR